MASALESVATELAVVKGLPRAPSHVVTGRVHTGVPPEIEGNAEIDAAMRALPANYSFEVKKTVWKIKQAGARRVALQMPEGLLLYACTLADIVARFTGAETVVMGDVTYGACCIDDFSAAALGCDFLVHYGHSCLVPIDIAFDTSHLARCIASNWPGCDRLALMGTVQFVAMLHDVRAQLSASHPHLYVPQAKPLSPGETLGCTAPRLTTAPDGSPCTAVIFVADGRFHLEAVLIANPGLPVFRYDPYSKLLTAEGYDHASMTDDRRAAVVQGARGRVWGLILGTLGRQGNPLVLDRLEAAARGGGKETFTLAMSEIKPASLARFPPGSVDAWVQVACPRLSIDWGSGFSAASGGVPLLNTYEAHVALGLAQPWWTQGDGGRDAEVQAVPATPATFTYPMDYYSRDAGPWGNYWKEGGATGGRKDARKRDAQHATAVAASGCAPPDALVQPHGSSSAQAPSA